MASKIQKGEIFNIQFFYGDICRRKTLKITYNKNNPVRL